MAVSGQLRPFRGVRLSEKREKRKSSREREIVLHEWRPEDETCSRTSPSLFPFIFFRPSFRLACYTRPTIIIKQPKSKLIPPAREMNNPEKEIFKCVNRGVFMRVSVDAERVNEDGFEGNLQLDSAKRFSFDFSFFFSLSLPFFFYEGIFE